MSGDAQIIDSAVLVLAIEGVEPRQLEFVALQGRDVADEQVPALAANGYRDYLERHGGRRPKRADSFHTALRGTHIEPFLDNWSLFDAFM